MDNSKPSAAPKPPAPPAAPKADPPKPPAAPTPPVVPPPPAPEPVKESHAVRVVHDFPMPYNNQMINFKKGEIITDKKQAEDLLAANCPVVKIAEKDYLVCPKCYHHFS